MDNVTLNFGKRLCASAFSLFFHSVLVTPLLLPRLKAFCQACGLTIMILYPRVMATPRRNPKPLPKLNIAEPGLPVPPTYPPTCSKTNVSWYVRKFLSLLSTSPSVSGILKASTIPLTVTDAIPPLAPGSIAIMEFISQITLESQVESGSFRRCLKLRSTGRYGPRA